MVQLAGVHTALVTPFRDDSLDLPAFRDLVLRQLAAGVHGLVVVGTTGETPVLDAVEWDTLVSETVSLANRQVLVTAGCGTNSTRSTVQRVARAKELGADAALLVLPYYNKPNPDGHRAHLRAAAEVGLPLIVYHVPGRTGQRLPPEFLAELCGLEGVLGCKEATGDVYYANHLLDRVKVPVLSGDDHTFFPLCALGARGVISVVSNLAPAATVRLWNAVERGDLVSARAEHFRLVPAMDWLFHTTSPLPCKKTLADVGRVANEARLPLVPISTPTPADVLAVVE